MPIYEYRCEDGHTFEVMHRMSDDGLSSCTTCGAAVKRVFHPVAVHFKGSGFYATDYGKNKPKDAEEGKSDKASDDASKKSSDTSTGSSKSDGSDSKPKAGKSESEHSKSSAS